MILRVPKRNSNHPNDNIILSKERYIEKIVPKVFLVLGLTINVNQCERLR